jgi:hypothetical protein
VIQLTKPAMTATRSAPADVRAGATLEVVLEHADIRAGEVRFCVAG